MRQLPIFLAIPLAALACGTETSSDGDDGSGDDGFGDASAAERPRAGTSIDLHSAEYRIWFDGAEYKVRSEALPAFAIRALGADATIDGVMDALPWAGEGLEAAGRARRK